MRGGVGSKRANAMLLESLEGSASSKKNKQPSRSISFPPQTISNDSSLSIKENDIHRVPISKSYVMPNWHISTNHTSFIQEPSTDKSRENRSSDFGNFILVFSVSLYF